VPINRGSSSVDIPAARTNLIGSSQLRRWASSDAFLIATFVCISTLLRLQYLTSKSLNLDEGFSAFMGRADAASFKSFIVHGEVNMLVYYCLLRLVMHVATGEFWIRLLSVLFGVASVATVFLLAKRLFGRCAAIFASIFLIVHPAHIAISQGVRSYALVVLLISLSCLFFLRLLDPVPNGKDLLAYIALSVLAVYSHLFAVLVIIAQGASLLFLPRRLLPIRALLKAAAALAVLLSPLAAFLILHGQPQAAWVPRLNVSDIFGTFYLLALPNSRVFLYIVPWAIALWMGVVSPAGDNARRWPYLFLIAWLLVPISIAVVASIFRPMLVPRFLAVSLPAAVLLAAAGVSKLAELSRWLAGAFIILILLQSLSSVRFYFRNGLNEDWRGATAYAISHSQTDDRLIVLPAYARFAFDYYYETNTAKSHLRISDSIPAAGTPPPHRVWFLASRFIEPRVGEDGVKAFQAAERGIYCATQYREFSGVKLWVFESCGQ
jgi:hypothetical protein